MTKPQMRWTVLPFLILVTALLVAVGCGSSSNSASNSALEELPTEFQRMAEVWRLLQREHIDGENLDSKVLSDGAIRGMMRALDDPYAAFLNPDQFALETQDIQGFFEGIGAEVGVRDGQITILAPMPDTPADKAGIRPGDIILEIEGESTRGISLLETVAKIRGQKGTSVQLLVLHLNSSEPELLTIIRGVIPLESVRLLMQVGRIGHLRVFGFTGTTNEELEKGLRAVRTVPGSRSGG